MPEDQIEKCPRGPDGRRRHSMVFDKDKQMWVCLRCPEERKKGEATRGIGGEGIQQGTT